MHLTRRLFVFLFGVVSYLVFLGTFLYFVGFLGNFLVPRTIDGRAAVPPVTAVVDNLILILLFGLQHSVMARPGFKRVLTQFVPEAAERSVYVLASSLAMIVLCGLWQPIPLVVWDVQDAVLGAGLWGLFAAGWMTILMATFLIHHSIFSGCDRSGCTSWIEDYTPLPFKTPGPYQYVRHPLYVGWIMATWATPTMTAGHLLLAAGMTVYILIAIGYEERDLVDALGREYANYRNRVPMLLPRLEVTGRLGAGVRSQ